MSMGERSPLAVLNPPASGRMAVAEAITNLLLAPIELERVKLSANWMAACGEPGEEAALFETVAYPALMHCKSGSDRAGVMAVLYAHFRLGQPLREALKELSLRYLHVRQGKTGVLDYTFERYFAEGEPAGLSFLEWVRRPDYDPKRIKADFHAAWWGTLLTERLLKRE